MEPSQQNGGKPHFRVTAPTDQRPQTQIYQIPRGLQGEVAVADPVGFLVGAGRGVIPWNPSSLVTREGLDVFYRMRDDDQVKAALSLKKHSVVATGWSVKSPEGMEDDWEVTRFIEYELNNLEGTFEQALLPILTALDFGFSLTEKNFEMRMEGEFAGKIGLKSLKTKKPDWLTFETDSFGNILPDGIIQESLSGRNRLPKDKFILVSYQNEFGNPYGKSDLESAYRAWWTKENAYTWLAMLLEKFGIPPIFALYNSAKWQGKLVDNLKTVIGRIAAGTAGVIPRETKDDLELWSPELGGQVASVFIPALDRFDRDIARAILMPGLLGLTADQTQGSLARARVQFDVFLLVVEYIRNILQETVINEQLIRPLVDLNYPVDDYPTWELNPITDNARLDILERWEGLVDKGVVGSTPEDEVHIRGILEMPERTVDEIEEDEEPDMPPDQMPPDGQDMPMDGMAPEDMPQEDEQRRPFARESFSEALREKEWAAIPGNRRSENGKHSCFREANTAEKHVNFQRIERTLDKHEKAFLDEGVRILTAERDKLLRRLKARNTLTSDFKPRINTSGLESVMKKELNSAFRAGRKEVRSEFAGTRKFQQPGVKPAEALKWLGTLVTLSVKGVDDDLNNKAVLALLHAIDLGEGVQGAMDRIRSEFEPYIGNPAKITDGKVVTPSRLETIARTNTTTAFNKGRITQIRQLDQFIEFVEYSAIIDSRTTEICQHLDGRRFAVNSPNLDRFTPPNHFNCRSVLVPITPDVDPAELPEKDSSGLSMLGDDPRVLKKTRELVPQGFGGDPNG